jgi:hypothetical protein
MKITHTKCTKRTKKNTKKNFPLCPLCPLWLKVLIVGAALVMAGAAPASRLAASDPGTGDWPMWGGTPDRNMVSNMKGLPTEWDLKTK